MTELFENGAIVTYPYLWRRQAHAGQEHGEKDRPVCLALTFLDPIQRLTHLVILPISSKPPFEGQIALEIPPLELRRGGLSIFRQGWITVSEYNYDIVKRSYHFDPNQSVRGRFGPVFLNQIRQALRQTIAAPQLRIDRTL